MNAADANLETSRAPINPRWVSATLKTRGILAPEIYAMVSALSQLDNEEREVFRGKIMRLNSGSDSPEDMSSIAAWANRLRLVGDQHSMLSQPTPSERRDSSNGKAAGSKKEQAGEQNVKIAAKTYAPSLHVYSSSAAICLEPVEVGGDVADDRIDRYWTIQIEMAKAVSLKKYDWEKKIIFRFTKRELTLFAAVLCGHLPHLQLANHGPGGDKRLAITDQGGNLYFDLRQGKKGIPMPVGGDEIFSLSAMALMALGRNATHLDTQTILSLVRRAGVMYGMATAATPVSRSGS